MTHHTGLENRRSGNVTEGSNPSLSAVFCGHSPRSTPAHGAPFTPRTTPADGAESGTPKRTRAKRPEDKANFPDRRFDARILKTSTGCWEWQGSVNSNGYGKFRIAGRDIYAHRFSYERFVGRIKPGLTIDHICRNRRCVNPEHLDAVTHAENVRRARDKSPHPDILAEIDRLNSLGPKRGCNLIPALTKNEGLVRHG